MKIVRDVKDSTTRINISAVFSVKNATTQSRFQQFFPDRGYVLIRLGPIFNSIMNSVTI